MRIGLTAVVLFAVGCSGAPAVVPSVPVSSLPGHGALRVDTSPKEEQRLVSPEAYLRTYLQIFGAKSALDMQNKVHDDDWMLFDYWNTYLATLGMPDYKFDLPRVPQTSALMIATFERLGMALCDRAALHELHPKSPPPIAERRVFAFEGSDVKDDADFAAKFDVLHRTFLGYPAAIAPTDRTRRFRVLFHETAARHAKDPPQTRLTPAELGWVTVCEGLVRHPEFHLY
ncbi:MAG: hypothetical protein ACXWUG_12840 [Polyangiales bacterium]